MKKIKSVLMLLLIVFVASCRVDSLQDIGENQIISGGLSVDFDKVKGVQMIENTLTYDGVELLAKIENTRNQSIEEYGVYFSTIENFSLGQASKVEASNLGTLGGFDETYFSNNLSNLNDKMTYYFRFYVKHSGGLSLSDLQSDASFTTKINYRVPETLILSEDKKIGRAHV